MIQHLENPFYRQFCSQACAIWSNFQLHFPRTRLFSLCKGQVNKRVTGNPEVFSLQIRSPEKVWWDRTLWTQVNRNRVIRGMSLNPEWRLPPLSQETLILHTQHPKLPRKHHISKKNRMAQTYMSIHSFTLRKFLYSFSMFCVTYLAGDA
jgi:hypothetical protein